MHYSFRGRRPRLAAFALSVTSIGLIAAVTPVVPALAVSKTQFTIFTDQSALTLTPGSSATVNLTVTRVKGFTAPVYLGARSLPRGFRIVTGANPLKGSSTTVKISVDASVAPKSYSVTLSGSSKGKSSQKTIKIAVVRATATTAPASSGPASSVPATLAPVATTAPVATLAPITTAPPTLPTTTTSTVPATTTSTAPASTTTTTSAFKDYALVAEPGVVTMANNGIAEAKIRIDRTGGFSDILEFTTDTLPEKVSATFSPVTATSPFTILTLRGSGASQGSSDVVVRSRSRTTKFQLNIVAAQPISATAATVTVAPGGSVPVVVRLGRILPANAAIQWTTTALPAGVTAGFSPNGVTSVETTMTVSATAAAALGSTALTVTATGGGGSDSLPITIVVAAAPSSTIVSPTTPTGSTIATIATIPLGGGGTGTGIVTPATVTIAPGSSGSVVFTPGSGINVSLPGLSLAQTGLPANVEIKSATITGAGLSLPLAANAAATPGTYTVTFTLTQGSLSSSGSLQLTIGTGGAVVVTPVTSSTTSTVATTTTTTTTVATGDGFSFSVSPSTVTVVKGNSVTIAISPLFTGATAPIGFTIDGVPAGSAVGFGTNPSIGATSVTLTIGTAVASGNYTLKITGSITGRGSQSITVPLVVT